MSCRYTEQLLLNSCSAHQRQTGRNGILYIYIDKGETKKIRISCKSSFILVIQFKS